MWIDRFIEESEMDEFWEGHRGRLRMRMFSRGFEGLKFHEQIELMLYAIIQQKDMSDLARNVSNAFNGSMQNFIDAPPEAFDKIPGMTKHIMDWLLINQELVRSYLAMLNMDLPEICSLRDSIEFIKPFRKSVHPPESWIVYMDFENRIKFRKVITPSLAWGEPEYVRQMIIDCTSIPARYAVIFLFVGVLPLEIGDYDRERLLPIAHTLRTVGVELVDVILVGESGYLSISRDPIMDKARAGSIKMKSHERYLMERPDEDFQWDDED